MDDLVLVKFNPRVTRIQLITAGQIEEYQLSLPPRSFQTDNRIDEPDIKIITSKRGTDWIRQLLIGIQKSIFYNVSAWIKYLSRTVPLEDAVCNFLKSKGAWGIKETPIWLVSVIKIFQELYPEDVLVLEQKRGFSTLDVLEHLVFKTLEVAKGVDFSFGLEVKHLVKAGKPFLAFSELEGSKAFVVTKGGSLFFRSDPFPSVEWISTSYALEYLEKWGEFYAFIDLNERDIPVLERTFSMWAELLAEPYVDVARRVLESFSWEVNVYVVSLFLDQSQGARVRAIVGPINQVRPFESMLRVMLELDAKNLSGLFASFLIKLPKKRLCEQESAEAFLKWVLRKGS